MPGQGIKFGAVTFVCAWSLLASVCRASLLIGSDSISGSYSRLVEINPLTGFRTIIGPLNDPVVAGLAWDPNHQILYGSSTSTDRLLRINPSTAAVTAVGAFNAGSMQGLEYDSVHDALYGTNSINHSLYSIDATTGAATLVGPYGDGSAQVIDGLAYDPVHQVMYGATFGSSSFTRPPAGLYTMDLQTGTATFVGGFGEGSSTFPQGLAFDPVLGLFGTDTHGADANFNNELYKINPATGAAALVGPMGTGNVLGLTFVPEPSSALLIGVLISLRASQWTRVKFRHI